MAIGYVSSDFDAPGDPKDMRSHTSEIVIESDGVDGLYRIEETDFVEVLFAFHESDGYELVGERRDGGERGVFASRSPRRPCPIGSTTVRLLDRDGPTLAVRGIDAIDGTPALDVRPFAETIDTGARFEDPWRS